MHYFLPTLDNNSLIFCVISFYLQEQKKKKTPKFASSVIYNL